HDHIGVHLQNNCLHSRLIPNNMTGAENLLEWIFPKLRVIVDCAANGTVVQGMDAATVGEKYDRRLYIVLHESPILHCHRMQGPKYQFVSSRHHKKCQHRT